MKTVCRLGIFCVVFCLSCTPSPKEIVFPQVEKVRVNLLGDSSIIGTPLGMIKYHNLLLISDFRGDSLIWVFDVSKNKMIKKWIGRGNGPDEFLSPIQMTLNDSVLAIQGRGKFISRKYQINVSSLTLEGVEPLLRIPTDIDRFYPLNKDRYIASGRFEEGRYAVLDREGKIVQYFGDYPNYKTGEDRIPNFPKFMFHQTMFTYNSHREKLASVTRHVLEIINFSGNQPKVEKQILLSPYDYIHTAEGSVQQVGNFQTGVTCACSTYDYIYLVYNPIIANNRNGSEKELENPQIWMFDWDGKPVKMIQTDLEISYIYVENDNKTGYCMVNAPNPALARFTFN